MDSFELTNTLAEHGIAAPDKCLSCPRLGNLAMTLSQAQDEKSFFVVSTDTEVMTSSISSQLSAQVKERFPDATDEQVASTVQNSIERFMSSDKYTNALKTAGALLEAADVTITSTVNDINSLLEVCPIEGCVPTLPE